MSLCGACKQIIEVQAGFTNPAHWCKNPRHAEESSRAYVHSALQRAAVWQPVADGEGSFCSKACLIEYNQNMLDEHRDSVTKAVNDGEEPPPPPDLLPVRRREGEDCEMRETVEAPEAAADIANVPAPGAPVPAPAPAANANRPAVEGERGWRPTDGGRRGIVMSVTCHMCQLHVFRCRYLSCPDPRSHIPVRSQWDVGCDLILHIL